MIKISRLADYSAVILNHLSVSEQQHWSAHQIAAAVQMPQPTVSKCLKLLNEAGLLLSSRGVNGGYRLSRDASEINLAELISAIDGDLALTECSSQSQDCIRSTICGLRHNWQTINQMIVCMLQQLTLQDMRQPLKKRVSIEDE